MRFLHMILFIGLALIGLQSCEDNSNDESYPENIQAYPAMASPGTVVELKGGILGTNPSKVTVRIGGQNIPITASDDGILYITIPRGASGVLEVINQGNTVQITDFSITPNYIYAYGEGVNDQKLYKIDPSDFSVSEISGLDQKIGSLSANPFTRQVLGYNATYTDAGNEVSMMLYSTKNNKVTYNSSSSLLNLTSVFAAIPTESTFWGFVDLQSNKLQPVIINEDLNLTKVGLLVTSTILSSASGSINSDDISAFLTADNSNYYLEIDPEDGEIDGHGATQYDYDKIVLDPFRDNIYCLRQGFVDVLSPRTTIISTLFAIPSSLLILDMSYLPEQDKIIVLGNDLSSSIIKTSVLIYDIETQQQEMINLDSSYGLLRLTVL